MNDGATCPVDTIDMSDPAVIECPWSSYRRLRDEAPVFQDPKTNIWHVSTYDLVSRALLDTGAFSSNYGHELRSKATGFASVAEVMKGGYPRPDVFHQSDPPEHTRFRKLVDKAFFGKNISHINDLSVTVSHALIDTFAARGRVEFVAEFAQLLPMTVIARMMGIPESDMPSFRRWSDAVAAQISAMSDEATAVEAARGVVEFQHYFAAMIHEKRARPTDDLISAIANASLTEEGDDSLLEIPEALQIIQQLLVAGNESTASAMADGMKYLIERSELIERIRADEDARLRAVEEMVRIVSPVHALPRITKRDVEIGGITIPAGSHVMVRFGSANHDEAMFADPEEFDPFRPNLRRHIGFGLGIHVCIGALLARKEMVAAFGVLFDRLSGWRLGPENDFTHNPSIIVRSMKRLNLEFDATRA